MFRLFALSNFLVNIGYSAILPWLGRYAVELGGGPFEVAVLFAANFIFVLILSPVFGYLGDRYGRALILSIMTTVACISIVMTCLATTLVELYIWRALGGITSAAFGIYMSIAKETLTEERRGIYLAEFHGAASLATVLAPALLSGLAALGVLNDLKTGATMINIVCSALSLIVFLTAIVPISQKLKKHAPEKRESPGLHVRDIRLSQFADVINLDVLASVLALTVYTGIISVMHDIQSLWNGNDADVAASLFLALSLGNVAARFVAYRYSRPYLHPRAILYYSLLIASGATCALPFGSSAVFIIVDIFIVSTCLNTSLSAAVETFASKNFQNDEEGVKLGLINSIISSGRVFGPLCFATLISSVGVAYACIILATALTICAIVYLATRHRTPVNIHNPT